MSNIVSLQAFGCNRPLHTIVETANSEHETNGRSGSPSRQYEVTLPPHSARSGLEEWKSCTSDGSDTVDDRSSSPSPQDFHPLPSHVGPRTSSKTHRTSHEEDRYDQTSAQLTSSRESGTYSTIGSSTEATSARPQSSRDALSELGDQATGPLDDYDLAAPLKDGDYLHSMETLSGLLYAPDHLRTIFADPSSLLDFTSFLSACRPQSVPMLMYYLDATEALKAVNYAIAISKSLEPIPGHDFTSAAAEPSWNTELNDKAEKAFAVLVQDDLPAFVTQVYVQNVKSIMIRRTMAPSSPSMPEVTKGLLEVFCLTDPSRPDNPIVFASEAFHRMTEYSLGYVIGRNCRFLQGPKTQRASVARIRKSVDEGRDHCELILNYRRDGSPFMNLLMLAPLRDVNGKIRYCLGAQIDVSDLVPDSAERDGGAASRNGPQVGFVSVGPASANQEQRTSFGGLGETFDGQDPPEVPRWRGQTNRDNEDDDMPPLRSDGRRPGLLVRDSFAESVAESDPVGWVNSKLSGFYQNYLLLRPYPSLRVLFASPSLHSPGILQTPVLDKIAVASSVREELLQALSQCRSVTVKVRWVMNPGDRGRRRWIAFTPLIGSHTQVGVWVAILVDDELEEEHRLRQGPSVRYRASHASRVTPPAPIASISKESSPGPKVESTPAPMREKPTAVRDRSPPGPKESPPPSPRAASISSSMSALAPEIDEAYESLEERLRKKRVRDAARLRDNPGATLKPTYKSLSPYAFMNNDAR